MVDITFNVLKVKLDWESKKAIEETVSIGFAVSSRYKTRCTCQFRFQYMFWNIISLRVYFNTADLFFYCLINIFRHVSSFPGDLRRHPIKKIKLKALIKSYQCSQFGGTSNNAWNSVHV